MIECDAEESFLDIFFYIHASGIEVILTEIGKNEIGISEIPLCDGCRE